MVTTSHLTKKLLKERPFLHEALAKGLVNVVALAKELQPEIERELGEVKTSAISMAIRRYMDEYDDAYDKIQLREKTDLTIKSNLFELSILTSQGLHEKLRELYNVVNFDVGDTLNIIHGNYEVLIVSNEKYTEEFRAILEDEEVKKENHGLSSLSMKIPDECIDAPGFYFAVTKALAMENISIVDIVNTETEATFIFDDEDVSRAYDVLKEEIAMVFYDKP